MGEETEKPQPKSTALATFNAVMWHYIIAIALFAILVVVVPFPKFREIFMSLGTELPALTRMCMSARHHLLLCVSIFFGFIALDTLVYHLLRRSGKTAVARTWWWLVLSAELLAAGTVILALFLPLLDLMTKVSQSAGQ